MVKIYFVFILFVTAASAQINDNSKTEFSRGVNFYSSSNLAEAFRIFSTIAQNQKSPYSIPARIFTAKILIDQENLSEAAKILNEFNLSVIDTSYRKEILLNKSIIDFRQGDFYASAEELIKILQFSKGDKYYSYAKTALDTIAIYNLTSAEVTVLYDLSRKETRDILQLLLGKAYLAEGKPEEAKKIFLNVMKNTADKEIRKEAEDFFYQRRNVKIQKEGDPVLVLLFPEAGETISRSVNQIIEGIRFAVHEFNLRREEKLGILSITLEQDKIKEIRNSILGLNAKGVMGPLFSEDVRLVLNEFKGIKLPLISPTATDNDLVTLNKYFFQANPNFTYRAKAMAQYIFYVENKRRIGILNSLEGYSPLLASEFSKEFRSLGGEVVIQETYKSRSGILDEPVSRISSQKNNMEGLYVPISDKEDISQLLNAFSANSLSLPLYGNQDWFLGKGYEIYPGIINNIIFTSDYFIDYNSASYDEFNAEFRKTAGMEAERNVLYGYDITKYFLNQMTKINAGADLIAERMVNGNTVTGYHNNICFDEERVNKYVNLVRYRDGVFELVDKYKTSR
jgi:ABC-type branched-subunit amino acid transport system substrate-binding protein/tetratricopeptide (TPR) repeat protein